VGGGDPGQQFPPRIRQQHARVLVWHATMLRRAGLRAARWLAGACPTGQISSVRSQSQANKFFRKKTFRHGKPRKL
jgi:hypothetical protein